MKENLVIISNPLVVEHIVLNEQNYRDFTTEQRLSGGDWRPLDPKKTSSWYKSMSGGQASTLEGLQQHSSAHVYEFAGGTGFNILCSIGDKKPVRYIGAVGGDIVDGKIVPNRGAQTFLESINKTECINGVVILPGDQAECLSISSKDHPDRILGMNPGVALQLTGDHVSPIADNTVVYMVRCTPLSRPVIGAF